MSNNVLMVLSGSKVFSNSWKQEMVIKDTEVTGEAIVGIKRIKMSLPYNRIAQVNIIRGVFKADLEVVNAGGAHNLIIKALDKDEAEKAKTLIESKIKQTGSGQPSIASFSVADELRKLSELKDAGILTQDEFERQKAKLLTER